MYSLVMMTAMVTAPSGPEFNGYFRDLFHRGGCCGTTSQSNSCCGGGLFHGRIISFFSFGGGSNCCGSTSKSTCTGSSYACCGGSGYAASSCSGSVPSYSCSGSVPSYSCSGSSLSCTGGSMPGGVPMDMGSPYAIPSPATYYSPPIINSYSYPGPIVYPTITPLTSVPVVPPSDSAIVPTRMEGRTEVKNQLPLPGGPASNRATVVVKLPADAKLYAESQLLELTSNERTFYTPELPTGRDYAYSFKIEYTRNGRTVSEAQKVSVTAGKTSTVMFDDLTLGAKEKNGNTAVVSKPEEPAKPVSAGKDNPFHSTIPAPAKITVKLPENGTLFIDGKKNEKAGTERQFTTPPLPVGKEFSYSMKLEMVRNGQPEEVTQKVVFQAGEILTVDFSDATRERRVSK
ncbi:TIGR03000 domain-containing protein [Limnoglobus roseus]|uniref:TIGR03000 domain-containing protein n=1 Tax=Limnoglobus roseus TaxID=2598579 RepID=A0A5C1AT63_9BACT|nr:TIGR03000 domain-containing protein [Limnoglobus roseus]QEL20394.1 TIGR03000 domain-containing protein [Limnoglobus roseus]